MTVVPRATEGRELVSFAASLGVAPSYVDVDGVERDASERALRAVCDLLAPAGRQATTGPVAPFDEVVVVRGGRIEAGAGGDGGPVETIVELEAGGEISASVAQADRLDVRDLPVGIHRLHWRAADGREGDSTLLAAPRRFPRPARTRPGRTLFAPAYSLWDEAEPLPSYDGLRALARAAGEFGVDTIATLPLYAPGSGDRFQSSPYSPVSRFHWNELLVPDRLLQPDRVAAGAGSRAEVFEPDRVRWAAVAATRWAQLDERAATLDDRSRAALDAFLASRPDVTSYAAYMAGGDRDLARRHEVGQWLAEVALGEVRDDLDGLGRRLALDLPVGARGESWETATWPHLFSPAASIGAPPDTFFAGGQNWGLPPLIPTASRRDGHRVWHDLLETACRFARVVRIDHVMQVFRLWWIPAGHAADDGVYVRYPADELLAVAAIVAERTGTTMVGENLGTVPPDVVRLLDDWGLVGMYEEVFTLHGVEGERDGDAPAALPPVPAGSWAGVRTHDMPALAATLAELPADRYRRALAADLGRPVGDDPADVLVAMVERLERSDALDVVVDVDDALGVTEPHNVPGVVDDHNWTRRLPVPATALADEPGLARVFAARRGKDANP